MVELIKFRIEIKTHTRSSISNIIPNLILSSTLLTQILMILMVILFKRKFGGIIFRKMSDVNVFGLGLLWVLS